jgi:predicted nucleic acid-binding protein
MAGFRAQTTFAVLLEAFHALSEFPPESEQRFYRLLMEVNWELLEVPPKETLAKYEPYIALKDVHVVAAAVEGQAEFLLTLDRRHILAAADAIARAGLRIVVLRPGDFIRQYYPEHEDYSRLPAARLGAS